MSGPTWISRSVSRLRPANPKAGTFAAVKEGERPILPGPATKSLDAATAVANAAPAKVQAPAATSPAAAAKAGRPLEARLKATLREDNEALRRACCAVFCKT